MERAVTSNSATSGLEAKIHSDKFKHAHNKHEWDLDLDKYLYDSVLRHYFNFDIVSMEVSQRVKSRPGSEAN